MDLGIQGAQVLSCGLGRFDICPIGCRTDFTVHRAACHKARIFRCYGSCTKGALPLSHIISGHIGSIHIGLLVQVVLYGSLDGIIGYVDGVGFCISVSAFGNCRICTVNHFHRVLGQILDHRLPGVSNVGEVLQVRNIGGIVGNVRFIRIDMTVQGCQILAC